MEILTWRAPLRRHIVRWIVCCFLIIPAALLGQEVDEYEVKAACLFNFTKFIEWPKSIDSSPFAICILGDDPSGPALDLMAQEKVAGGPFIQDRKVKEADGAREYQMVFVCSTEGNKRSTEPSIVPTRSS